MIGREALLAALRRMQVETGSLVCLGCGYEHNCSIHGCAILREAVKALEAPEPADNEPLALEQLRGMRGKWVWIESPDRNLTVSGWAYVGKDYVFTYWEYEEDKLVGRIVYNICDYGAWLAYTYPPVHIDREAWTAEWRELHGDKMVGLDDCGEDVYRHYHYSVCTSCGKGTAVKSNFCPSCGRAMTPEAWAELEKRLRG